MGYTHYYTQYADFTNEEWEKIKSYTDQMISSLPATSASAGGYYSDEPLELANGFGEEDPVVDDDEIWLNGKGKLGHETFHLSKVKPENPDYVKDRESYWDFVKTARKPYDLIVTAILFAANVVAPNTLQYDSDGDNSEWTEGVKLFAQAHKKLEAV